MTLTLSIIPPMAKISASTVPSPPSASGLTVTITSGIDIRIPFFMASPAFRELKLPLKESTATVTFIQNSFSVA